MAKIAATRIQRELKEVVTNEEIAHCKIHIRPLRDTYNELQGEIAGSPDTPYEGGTYKLRITIPETYPFDPPKVQFVTKIWHPNISSVTGTICLDILGSEWAASMTLRTVLLSLQVLLSSPDPDSPQDAVVASQYKSNPSMFRVTARHWANVYAGAPESFPDLDKKVKDIVDMGISEDDARMALSLSNWDLNKAVHHLFG